jgi:deoxyhypusine synthase
MSKRDATSGPMRCSFCDKAENEVARKLIAGPSVFICHECVELCQQIIADDHRAAWKDARSPLLSVPIEPFIVEPGLTAEQILTRMERISFQGRNLATAHRIWQKMLEDDVLIFLGVAGALTAGGLRLVIAHLIEHRYIDCLVSTGANLYHDLHETRGRHHYMGSPDADDGELQVEHIDRVYDTFVSEDEFIDNDIWIATFVAGLERRPYTSREFLYLLGRHLWDETRGPGILTAASRANVPIFCPGIADSSIGMGLSQARHKDQAAGLADVIGDIVESANLVIRRRRTATVILGGGTPKNFINQASVQAGFFSPGVGGHAYALQIVTDVPHFGGASGSTLAEARSWGKVATDADQVTVNVDATIGLPLLAAALATSARERLARRRPPQFDVARRVMTVDGEPLPDGRFEERR